jgi:hypothetical protein
MVLESSGKEKETNKQTNNQKLARGERNNRNNIGTRQPYTSVMHQNIQSIGNKQPDVELALEVNLKTLMFYV